ncbi:hypothetical protein [Marinicella meishanensis]|uniref:hypothetical protein n=1 Tax=Marinicella meishanensis TaxID=2873263 RepID=UPI001CC096C0|nr:hypothetical protein [Marinicella sp. NBU2979]
MKFNVKMLEKMGQTQSIHQFDSVEQMYDQFNVSDQAFTKLKAQSNDLTCVLFPDDDDEE